MQKTACEADRLTTALVGKNRKRVEQKEES
jgi:hypothetical protein